MKNFKKGISLVAVIAFLITALVPIGALADSNSPAVWSTYEECELQSWDGNNGYNGSAASTPSADVLTQKVYVPVGTSSLTLTAVPGAGLTLANSTNAGSYGNTPQSALGSPGTAIANTAVAVTAGDAAGGGKIALTVPAGALPTDISAEHTYVGAWCSATGGASSFAAIIWEIVPVVASLAPGSYTDPAVADTANSISIKWNWYTNAAGTQEVSAATPGTAPSEPPLGAGLAYTWNATPPTGVTGTPGFAATPVGSTNNTWTPTSAGDKWHVTCSAAGYATGSVVSSTAEWDILVIAGASFAVNPNPVVLAADLESTSGRQFTISNTYPDYSGAEKLQTTIKINADMNGVAGADIKWDNASASPAFSTAAGTVVTGTGSHASIVTVSGNTRVTALAAPGTDKFLGQAQSGTGTPALPSSIDSQELSVLAAALAWTEDPSGSRNVTMGSPSPALSVDWINQAVASAYEADGSLKTAALAEADPYNLDSNGYKWTVSDGTVTKDVPGVTGATLPAGALEFAGSPVDMSKAGGSYKVTCTAYDKTPAPAGPLKLTTTGISVTFNVRSIELAEGGNNGTHAFGGDQPTNSYCSNPMFADDIVRNIVIQTQWNANPGLAPDTQPTVNDVAWTTAQAGTTTVVASGVTGFGDGVNYGGALTKYAPNLTLTPNQLLAGTTTYTATMRSNPALGIAGETDASSTVAVYAIPMATLNGANGSTGVTPASGNPYDNAGIYWNSVTKGIAVGSTPTLGIAWANDIVPNDVKYQWQKKNASGTFENIAGATEATYKVPAADTALAETETSYVAPEYQCVITNENGAMSQHSHTPAPDRQIELTYSFKVQNPALNPLLKLSAPPVLTGTPQTVTASWDVEPSNVEDWTYVWEWAQPDGQNATVPQFVANGLNMYFNPVPANAGTWTITCTAINPNPSTRDVKRGPIAQQTIDNGHPELVATYENVVISVDPYDVSIVSATPITYGSQTIYGTAGTSEAFSVTTKSGMDRQGKEVPGTVYWALGDELLKNSNGTPLTGTNYTWNIPATAAVGTTQTVTAYAVPNTPALTSPISLASVQAAAKSTKTWNIRIMDPNAKIQSVTLLPYQGTTSGSAATVSVGGDLAIKVALNANNDPEQFTYTWQVCKDGTNNWENLTGELAGSAGMTYSTNNVTPDMDGWTYRVVVRSRTSGTPATSGVYTLNVTAPITVPKATISSTSPRMTSSATQHSVIVAAGQNVTMNASVEISGGVPYTVQWQKAEPLASGTASYNWTDIPGATEETYVLENVSADDQGDVYRCVPTSAYSEGAGDPTLPVQINLATEEGWVTIESFTSEPAHGSTPPYQVLLGSNKTVKMTVEASADNGAALSYKWWVNENNTGGEHVIPGATGPEYTTAVLQAGTYTYRCEVSNADAGTELNSVSTNDLIVSVYPEATLPKITEQPPVYAEVRPGSTMNASISVQAEVTSGDSLSYQWYVQQTGGDNQSTGNWEIISGATNPTLTLNGITTRYNGNVYRCQVTNPATGQSVYSHTSTLRVYSPEVYPEILVPDDQSFITTYPVQPGDGFKVSFVAPADLNFSKYNYQWQYSPYQTGPFENVAASALPEGAYEIEQSISTERGLIGTMTLPAVFTSNGANGVNDATKDTYAPTAAAARGVVGETIPNGYYRLMIQNKYNAAGTAYVDPLPTNYSNVALVRVIYPNVPYIETQPAGVTVKEGEPAEFTIQAAVNPSTDGLVYRWQTWEYATTIPSNVDTDTPVEGQTGYWRNCVSSDGSGNYTNTFTTDPTTIQDRISSYDGKPTYFRCVVYDAASGESVTSAAARLTIVAPDQTPEPPAEEPTITPSDDSPIKIEGEGADKVAVGVTGTKDGITASDYLDQLGYEAPEGYTLRIVNAEGEAIEGDAIVCTGYKLELVKDADETVVDSVTIIVTGDVLGTGQINISQLVRMARDLNGIEPLTGIYLRAGDFNGNDSIDIADLVAEARIISETIDIM